MELIGYSTIPGAAHCLHCAVGDDEKRPHPSWEPLFASRAWTGRKCDGCRTPLLPVSALPGTGLEVCECGQHRLACRFGRQHSWGMAYVNPETGVPLDAPTMHCMSCGSWCSLDEADGENCALTHADRGYSGGCPSCWSDAELERRLAAGPHDMRRRADYEAEAARRRMAFRPLDEEGVQG